MKNELHVQTSLWHSHAVLFLEGEAPDRTGGGMIVEALYQAVLARGLRLTTDLDHLDLRPVPAWRLRVDHDRSVTLEWPHHRPLFSHAPLDLPDPWLSTATRDGLVLIFAGYGLGMCEHAHDGDSHPLEHLEHARYTGALASGAVALRSADPAEPPDDVAVPAVPAPRTPPSPARFIRRHLVVPWPRPEAARYDRKQAVR